MKTQQILENEESRFLYIEGQILGLFRSWATNNLGVEAHAAKPWHGWAHTKFWVLHIRPATTRQLKFSATILKVMFNLHCKIMQGESISNKNLSKLRGTQVPKSL